MILAPDLVLNAADRAPPPNVYTLSPARPSLVVEVNGRPTTLNISSGTLEAQPIDGAGTLTGASTQVTSGSPLVLGSAGRWRLLWDGGLDGSSAPLVFT